MFKGAPVGSTHLLPDRALVLATTRSGLQETGNLKRLQYGVITVYFMKAPGTSTGEAWGFLSSAVCNDPAFYETTLFCPPFPSEIGDDRRL